jgi:branched-chain amino acid transport system permease protein
MKRAPVYEYLLLTGIGVAALLIPWLLPSFITQFTFLWVMVVFALTWDLLGGQMGYNSFGNVLFFGIGAYACAVVQRDSGLDYFTALALGLLCAALLSTAVSAVLGAGVLGMRGHYFAICTLGLGVAAGEIAGGWEYLGAGSGMVTPQYPGGIGERDLFYYFLSLTITGTGFFTLRRLYQGRFGLAINAIRDDEDKAEAMGLHTTRYKTVAWCVAAFFLALTGGAVGNLIGFIDPRDVAFSGATFGVWMILMAILGGKGTVWGPVLGAAVFHLTQELFWSFLFGWQRVALGALIVLIVVFFPQGILGWVRETWPERFGQRVDTDRQGGEETR